MAIQRYSFAGVGEATFWVDYDDATNTVALLGLTNPGATACTCSVTQPSSGSTVTLTAPAGQTVTQPPPAGLTMRGSRATDGISYSFRC